MKKLITLLPFIILACHEKTETPKTDAAATKNIAAKPAEAEEITYTKYRPDSLKTDSIKNFDKDFSFKIGHRYIVSGSYQWIDNKITAPDTEKNYGQRLLMQDENQKILYTSQGQGDVYAYDPNFFKNQKNGKVIIFARLGYEYNFGGDAYLLEGGNLKYLGNLDVEPNSQDYSTVDILQVSEKNNQFKFSFKADSLVFNPASGYPKAVKNNNFYYLYDGNKMRLVR